MDPARLYMNMFNFACVGTWKLLKIVALIIYLSCLLLSELSGLIRRCLETQETTSLYWIVTEAAGGGQSLPSGPLLNWGLQKTLVMYFVLKTCTGGR